jgi:phosphatidylserine decarboxylase
MMNEFSYWDKKEQKIFKESIFAGGFLYFAYEHKIGKILGKIFFSSYLFNYLYGIYKKSSYSKQKIIQDINEYQIDMREFKVEEYQNYRQFFLRKFKDNKRIFDMNAKKLSAFAEGKYLGYSHVNEQLNFPIKGNIYNFNSLFGNNKDFDFNIFKNGPMLICRLCPVDYHYYHFPDNGKIITKYKVHGRYHSVNFMALKQRPTIFFENERQITILETENFGILAYIEIGAMCVGKIIDTHHSSTFKKGEEKGFFDFGASTVVVIGLEGKWQPDSDILKYTEAGMETKIQLGNNIASVAND